MINAHSTHSHSGSAIALFGLLAIAAGSAGQVRKNAAARPGERTRSSSPSSRAAERAADLLLRAQAHNDRGMYREAVAELRTALALQPGSVEAHYQAGFALWQLGQAGEATRSFEQVLKLSPRHAQARYYLARIHLKNRNLDRAIALLEQMIRETNGRALLDEHLQLGQAYAAKGATARAVATLEAGAAVRPRDDRIFTQLGRSYLALGKPAEAAQAFARSTELRDYQREATRLLLDCTQDLKKGDFPTAFEIYNRLIGTQDVDDLVSLGIRFAESELYERAQRAQEAALRLDPGSFEARYNLGMIYYKLGKADLAAGELAKAVESKPYSFEATSLLGIILAEQGKNEPAIQALVSAGRVEPANVKVLTLLALQFLDGRYFSDALGAIDRALKVEPASLELRLLRIQALYRNHDFVEALAEAERALEQFPRSARARFEVGFQLENLGRFRESKPHFEAAARLDPGFPDALYHLGELLRKEERHTEAVRCFRSALEREPNHVDSQLGLARSLLAASRYDEGIEAMLRASALDPAHPEPHLLLAQAYRGRGEVEKAQEEMRKFTELNRERMARRDQEVERKYRP